MRMEKTADATLLDLWRLEAASRSHTSHGRGLSRHPPTEQEVRAKFSLPPPSYSTANLAKPYLAHRANMESLPLKSEITTSQSQDHERAMNERLGQRVFRKVQCERHPSLRRAFP
eukprot:scaffold32625_cov112-Isochrysis_galbana.AAC.2